jgi:hypothetical protein
MMRPRLYLSLALIALGLPFCAAEEKASYESDPPELPERGGSLRAILPPGWEVLAESYGDMNGDGAEDLAFVAGGTDPSLIEVNRDLGDERPVDHNPRILGIYFRSPITGLFEKKLQSNSFIPLKETFEMDEPFGGAEIEKDGALSIHIGFWTSWGSWSMSGTGYTFRYRAGRFELTALEYSQSWRNSGETTDLSIDFDAREATIEKSNFSTDDPGIVTTIKIDLDRLYALDELKPWYSGEEYLPDDEED